MPRSPPLEYGVLVAFQVELGAGTGRARRDTLR